MKKATVLTAFLLLLTIVYFLNISQEIATAHPGRTDSQGGHYDRSTGEYHFHDGGESSSGSSSFSLATPRVYPGVTLEPKPTPRPTPTPKPSTFLSVSDGIIGWIVASIGIILLLPVAFLYINGVYNGIHGIIPCKSRKSTAQKIQEDYFKILEEERKAREEAERKRREEIARKREAERAKYQEMYGGKTLSELVDVPPQTTLGPDGLPKQIGANGWGEKHTVYISNSGKTYHRKSCQYARFAIHAYQARLLHPCGKCWPVIPDYTWYDEYLEILKIKRKYKID